MIEFYRSPARTQWSPTGTNIPDYPKLAQLWWQNIGDAMSGAKTPQEALDSLCAEQRAWSRAAALGSAQAWRVRSSAGRGHRPDQVFVGQVAVGVLQRGQSGGTVVAGQQTAYASAHVAQTARWRRAAAAPRAACRPDRH
ncbi:hypothetical protein DPM13_09380 [Paracoccus mutanolyticus]|uniref:Uncharacterized protein n=1 Tax=Paracoccus mutanolyticus TaxID=1499308 RepID=A0ABN5M8D5_9RHOB|nr:hypothetical protein [Paracoccus mutanolyticus]AWX93253.1 hypothetical protein DPM13_09380 [Paracoccus mutanolyticus]